MEEGKQYSEYSVESNPRAYMTMRDYRNLPWHWQQPIERNPNPYRSMREYRDQWMSEPVYNVTSTYIPPASPHFTSTSQQQQPPPLSLVEQAILNLSKQVDDFIEEQRVVTVQANQETETVESSLNKELDGFQSEIDQKLDILQESISKLTNQFVQEEENLEEECLVETILVEQAQLQPQEELKEELAEDPPEELQGAPQLCVKYGPWKREEETSPMRSKEGNGKKEMEEPHQFTTKATNNPLPAAPPDSVFILPMPAAQPKPQASTTKATPSLLVLQNIRRLVASVHAFATTSKTMATAYIAWHSGWFGCGFGFGAPGPGHF